MSNQNPKMWYQIVTLLSLSIHSNGQHHISNNNSDSDVIVTYAGHADAEYVQPKFEPKPNIDTTTMAEQIKILIPESYATETTKSYEDETDGVVFIPNDEPVFRKDKYQEDRIYRGDVSTKYQIDFTTTKYTMNDVETKHRIGDLLNDKNIRVATTESPHEEILFISGRNSEHGETSIQKETEEKEKKKVSMNCSNLDCNNTINSVCGGKLEQKHWRYRLFLNECYFRKVNCLFKYEINRFREVPLEFCKHIGSHHSERPFIYNPPLPILPIEQPPPAPAPPVVLRRTSSSRRALNLGIDGSFCSHPCPITCTEDYSPECAVTTNGQRKVFVNHCKLDFNSCSYGTVWHRRPLSDCVGNKKADLQQNRAFIGWMQRIGIIDTKGKLVVA